MFPGPEDVPRTALLLSLLVVVVAVQAATEQQQDLPGNKLVNTVAVSSEAEAAVAVQMLQAFTSASKELVTGESDDRVFAFAAPEGAADVDVKAVATKVLSTALASWRLGVVDAPTNRGLNPSKFVMYNRTHFYQVPKDPIGTLVWFHGCMHDASAGWPYDPEDCPECLGLPEEVAHTKQALAQGYAILAVETHNRDDKNRCFSFGPDNATTDHSQAPQIVQHFVKAKGLANKPIYTAGVSSGASFAVKIPKSFYSPGYDIRISGAISEANAINMGSWALLNTLGELRYPGFPPVAYVIMGQNDPGSRERMLENVAVFQHLNIPSDWVSVWQGKVNESWFYERSPVITMQQSAAIVNALKAMGVVDRDGNLNGNPRHETRNKTSLLHQWNFKLAQRVPWLNMNKHKPPMLTVLSDRGTIFEEMNVAFAQHEIIADYLVPCLVWLRSKGRMDLKQLSKELAVQQLRDLTMDRKYFSPPPPREDPYAGSPPLPAVVAAGGKGSKLGHKPSPSPLPRKPPPKPLSTSPKPSSPHKHAPKPMPSPYRPMHSNPAPKPLHKPSPKPKPIARGNGKAGRKAPAPRTRKMIR